MKSYVSLLATDNYLPGVLCLHRSLERVSAAFPLVVMVTQNVSQTAKNQLKSRAISVKEIDDKFKLPSSVINQIDCLHWRHTFAKLAAFELDGFQKIVFLDSDMIVTQNIDHLFEKPHLSAARGSGMVQGYTDWTLPNSGLMVIEPAANLGTKIFQSWPQLAKRGTDFGDQDLIHHHFKAHWQQPEKWLLSTQFNCMVFLIDQICRERAFKCTFKNHQPNSLSVLHFVIKNRPWQMTRIELAWFYLRRLLKGKFNEVKATLFYAKLLREIS